MFDFLLGFFVVVVVPLEIRLHGCTLRRTSILRSAGANCVEDILRASVVWPLDLAGEQS